MCRKITPNTKAIVIINPNNPTGAMLIRRRYWKKDCPAGKRHGLILFSDEIYDRLVMDGKSTSIASLAPDVFTITMNGLSKSHRVAGFRIGWMCLSGPKDHVKDYIEGLNLLSSMRLCSNVPAQQIVAPALESWPEEDQYYCPAAAFEQRKVITSMLNDIPGVSVTHPDAAFYVFPKLDVKQFGITDDEQFVLDFLREKHVLLVHGGASTGPTPITSVSCICRRYPCWSAPCRSWEEFLDGYHQH